MNKTITGEVTVEDLCRRESRIQVFSSKIGSLDQCKNLCEKMQNGTMASVRTLNESQEMSDRMNEVLKDSNGGRNEAGMTSQAAWTPIRQENDGSWVDLYNKDPVKEIAWSAGQPKSDSCAIYVIAWKGLGSFRCNVNIKSSLIYCPCSFPVLPHLTLRGLCPNSHIDQPYLARNDPAT